MTNKGGKMGWQNRITVEQFSRIKKVIEAHPDSGSVQAKDKKIAAQCGVGKTTVTHIRLSRNYEDYCRRTKGKYWYASEHPKERPNLPQVKITKRAGTGGAAGCYEATPRLAGDHELILDNQIELNMRLRLYMILDTVLIVVLLILLALSVAGRTYGN